MTGRPRHRRSFLAPGAASTRTMRPLDFSQAPHGTPHHHPAASEHHPA
ncbi:MAG: hypothetical protein ABI073_03830 [Luteolibacter sp.]